MKKPLPDVWLHLRYFFCGLVGYITVSVMGSKLSDPPTVLLVLVALPCWIAVFVPIFGYLVVYPFLHLTGRYEGRSQQTWLVWLILDTVGLTFGLVRIWYYLTEIIPDFRQTRRDRIAEKTEANKRVVVR